MTIQQTRPAHLDSPSDPGPTLIGDPLHAEAGAVIGHGFANLYAITTRPDVATVRRVNVMKGRPPAQIGSITTTPSRIPDVWDWARLPDGLSRRRMLGVVGALFGLGPFGFRGPAAEHIPNHLTFCDGGVRTAQLIAPGYACPSNDFLARSVEACDDDLLYITSANRSRHLTGADDSPAHWRAQGLHSEFGHEPDFMVLEHGDELAARNRYPDHLPMSTTVLGFHRLGPDRRRPQLVVERHGSLHVDVVREVLDRLGFGLVLGPLAQRRLSQRT